MNQDSTHRPRAVVVGLGRTGVSCARHLLSRGYELAATDSRAAPPGLAAFRELAPQARVRLGGFDAGLLDGAALVVASPGVSLTEPIFAAARARGIDVAGDIELFARVAAAPTVAITGTNGKSTVTTLLGRMAERAGLRTAVGGNLGTPALELLDAADPQLYVLELSSFQLEAVRSLRLVAGAVLNVTSDHMDRYDGMAAYAAAKARIFMHCDVAIVNLDDEWAAGMVAPAQRTVGFSLRAGTPARWSIATGADGATWLTRDGKQLLASAEMRLAGLHNVANALAALALGEAAGLDLGAMLAELREFPGLAHRSQWVADVRGVRYVNDSKGTNVGATLAAVAGMPGTLVVIAGGDGKNQDFAPLAAAFAGRVRLAVLIGRDAPALAAVLDGACPVALCATLELAVTTAAAAALPGDTVLLSPACASLDMFRDYTHRGDVFAASVRRLAA
jgi:UDP-N-acetylmuramoylalanine--D-glutamate ligase